MRLLFFQIVLFAASVVVVSTLFYGLSPSSACSPNIPRNIPLASTPAASSHIPSLLEDVYTDELQCWGDDLPPTCSKVVLFTPEYLPDRALISRLAAHANATGSPARIVTDDVRLIQHGLSCDQVDMFASGITPTSGFGSSVQTLIVPLTVAVGRRRTLCFNQKDWTRWVYQNDDCHSETNPMSCVFDPMCSCIGNSAMPAPSEHVNPMDIGGWLTLKAPSFVPSRYARRGVGVFWFKAALSGFVWEHLTERVRAAVEEKARECGMDRAPKSWEPDVPGDDNCIALHIRLGDAYQAPYRLVVGLKDYVRRAKAMSAKYGVNRVFLSTDGDVTSQMKDLLGPEMDVTWQQFNRTKYESGKWIEQTLSEADPQEKWDFTMEIITDIELMTRCRYMIGSLTSRATKMALEIMALRLGYIPPYSSVDIPWCWSGYHRSKATSWSQTLSGQLSHYDKDFPC